MRQELLVRMSSQGKCSPGGGPWGTAKAPGQKYLLLSRQDLGLAPQLHQEVPSAAAEGWGLRVSVDVLPSPHVKTSPSPHEQGVVLLGGHGTLCDCATPPAPAPDRCPCSQKPNRAGGLASGTHPGSRVAAAGTWRSSPVASAAHLPQTLRAPPAGTSCCLPAPGNAYLF